MSENFTFTRESLQSLADSIEAMLAFVDTDQRYVFTNSTYDRWFGLTPSALVGKHVKDVLGEANYEELRDKIEDALTGKNVSYERDISLGDGTLVHFITNYIPHFDEQGKIQGFFVLAQNSDRSNKSKELLKKARIDLKDIAETRTTALLKKAYLELEQILNTVEHGIALINTNKRIMRVNQSMLTQSKLTEEEVIGRKCHDIFPVTACNTDACPIQRIIAGEPLVQIESERHRLDGSRFPCEVTAKPLLDIDGNLLGMVEDIRDTTGKMKRKEESAFLLQQAIQAEKLASLGTVVAGVAHEINNPNSFISYNAPMAEKIWQGVKPVLDEYAANNPKWRVGHFSYQEVAESMAETLLFIKTGSDRINGIVNSLKEFAGQDKEPDNTFIQVNDIINHAYTIVGAQIRKKVGTITLNLAENMPEIYGQFQRLEQVVINLILNAMDAIPDKKTGRISVTTKYNKRLQAVLINVEDNGHGMKQEIMDLMFDPFFTTHRNQGGTGLGLAVSFGLIKEHNGTISVLSLPGRGTRFTIFLPMDKRTQKKVEISPAVLCIDDDQHILQLFETFFKVSEDMDLTTRDDPDHILAYLDEHPEVELVFSDVMMPKTNGWELLAQIKNKFPLMPVVLFSADPTALEQREGFPQPDHIVQKPFTLKEITAITKSIDRRIL